jgi:phospholipid/cholesterol/gamma-HCH transport system substrate-binding protein
MDPRAAAKVGIMVLIGIVLFWGVWRFFAHLNLHRFPLYAVFDNTKGLQRQTSVRMNGVPIGEVKAIELDPRTLKPIVHLMIDNLYRNKIPADSVIRITSGILITNPQIEITPGQSTTTFKPGDYWPEQYVQKEPPGMLAQLSPEAEQAVRQLTASLEALTPKLSQTLDQLQGILKRTDAMLANLQVASGSARSLLTDPKIRQTLHATLEDLRAISHDARITANTLSAELRSTIKRNSSKLDELAEGAIEILQKMADTVDAARGMVTKLSEQVSDPRLQQSLQETVDLAKTTIARFNQIATDIHQLTGDPSVQSNLKTTVTRLKEATERGLEVAEKADRLLTKISEAAGAAPRFGIGRPSFSVDFLGRTQEPHFRSDIGMRLPIGQEGALRVGIYDFAETYKLNAQYETPLGRFGNFRYGIYASKLGVGFDWLSTLGTRFTLDAFSPNNFQLDARALIRINDDFSLWLGADSIFKRTTPLLGVRLTR